MGFRFFKRVKIVKGLSLNISKSGLGLSTGIRGLSLSVGKRGPHLNLGIPGTGLSYSHKLSGGHGANHGHGPSSASSASFDEPIAYSQREMPFQMSAELDEKTGQISLAIKDMHGQPITDHVLVERIRKLPEVKRKLAEANQTAFERMREINDHLVHLYKQAQPLVSLESVLQVYRELKPDVYERQPFPEVQPTEADVRARLWQQAEAEINDWQFWSLESRRRELVEGRLAEWMQYSTEQWQARKDAHEAAEAQKEATENAKLYQKWEAERQVYTQIINADPVYIEETLEEILSELELPVEFSVDFEVGERKVALDLDLPEIEDFPRQKPVMSASGKFSKKDKSAKELKEEYARSVMGLAFFFASVVFNISPAIKHVSIAGYTQRVSKKTGATDNEYVYDVHFDRATFARLNVPQLDPLEAVSNFRHQLEMTASYELKTIDL